MSQNNVEVEEIERGAVDYTMKISRLTVDKLGVKLYDKASAVVAELVANAYDADAELVRVRLPLSTELARKENDGSVKDNGYIIEVVDNGHGMEPKEANEYFLKVGRDRRGDPKTKKSREKQRDVMGRKGIGKLAPFGICKRIEVISAGGPKTAKGYLVSHFMMEFDKIVQDADEPVPLDAGPEDCTFRKERGTTIRLSCFLPKRVPDSTTFHRQLAARFIFGDPKFRVIIEDVRAPHENPPTEVLPVSVPVHDGTRVDLSNRPVVTEDGEVLPVSGWLGMAKESYKHDELAGVRIYARGKIIATTRDFEQPAGFTGEFTMRSYLVGEVHADWMDSDEGEDLVRTDRQSILWESDYGRALRAWGAKLIKEIAAASRKPRREKVRRRFIEVSRMEERAKGRFADEQVVQVALELAEQIGSFAAEDELNDDDYVDGLADMILAVAPHRALIQAFQEFNAEATGGESQLEQMLDLFGKTRVAEMASYSQIAAERVQVIRRLESIVHAESNERALQELVEEAPWLIEPTWSVLTKNQSLKRFGKEFERFWMKRTGENITIGIGNGRKRPDFTAVAIGQMLHIVEIKACNHAFDDNDFTRLVNYVDAFEAFFAKHDEIRRELPSSWRIDLVADSTNLVHAGNRHAYESFVNTGRVVRIPWEDFLLRAEKSHELFLDIDDAARVKAASFETG
jgi:hypothetical protein